MLANTVVRLFCSMIKSMNPLPEVLHWDKYSYSPHFSSLIGLLFSLMVSTSCSFLTSYDS